MTDSKSIRRATVATESGELDAEAYAEAACQGTVRCMTHDSVKRITYVSVVEARGRVFRLHHDTGRVQPFSPLYDVQHMALVPPERRTDADYMAICCRRSAAVYAADGTLTAPLTRFETARRSSVVAEKGNVAWCAFDALGQAIVWHSMSGQRVFALNGRSARPNVVGGGILHIQGGFTVVGPGVDRWNGIHSVRPLTNAAYGGGDDDDDCRDGDNILCGVMHEPRSDVMLAFTPRALWIQDLPAVPGSTPTCHMAYSATRDDGDDDGGGSTEFADVSGDNKMLWMPLDVVRKITARDNRVRASHVPRTLVSCMTLEYDDSYGDALRAQLRELSEAKLMCGMLDPLVDLIVVYARAGTCVLLADSGRRRLLRVPIGSLPPPRASLASADT